ncbi:MAG: hypothetical protein IKQ10_03325 [Oscillospiraceae bacterium]|nr:hypothetical protein [Oscillospiraceae bacterium]
MLSRFDNKEVRITTEDGETFTGSAEAFPSGYGLSEFGRAEESIGIDGTQLFKSDIKKIELLSETGASPVEPRQFDGLMASLLEGPYWIADILPEQVPADAGGRYFAVERYWRRPKRLRKLRRRFAEILLRLNCYYDMAVSFDDCRSWEMNPDPETFADALAGLSGNRFLRAVFPGQRSMADIEPDDTYMTVYDPDARLLDKLRALAGSAGLFVWSPPEESEVKEEP